MFEDEPEAKKQECPTPESVLEKILKRRRHKPKMFPSDPFQAARYWMAHQEQPKDWKENAEQITKDGKGVGWNTPYHDRLAVNLRIFFRLKYIHQCYVIENTEAGIPWRGDDIDFYTEVVREAQKMLKNKEQYIDNAKQIHKSFVPGGSHAV